MGDAEYAGVFSNLLLPVLYNYKPDLIIVACGLDAVKGDLIGDNGLSSAMYYTMTRSLLEAAPKTPIVMALEGGYNVAKSAECMENVTLALLDEPLDSEQRKKYIVWTTKVRLPVSRSPSMFPSSCLWWRIAKSSTFSPNSISCDNNSSLLFCT